MEKDSAFGFDQGGNPTYSEPRANLAPPGFEPARTPWGGWATPDGGKDRPGTLIGLDYIPPNFESESPLVVAGNNGDADGYAILAAAAAKNEPRVREVLGMLARAHDATLAGTPVLAAQEIRDAAFALGALLPPVGVVIRVRTADAKSLSGRKAA